MPSDDVLKVIGRTMLDPAFAQALAGNLDATLTTAGYTLNPDDRASVVQVIAGMSDSLFQQEQLHKRVAATTDRANELGVFSVQILKDTLNKAKGTQTFINWMNGITYGLGVVLFGASAVAGAVKSNAAATALLGGLGVATFIALFLLGPIKRSQAALSNLVQVEVAFVTFWEQMSLWEAYAVSPDPTTGMPNPARLSEASKKFQDRAKDAVLLLESFVERDGNGDKAPATQLRPVTIPEAAAAASATETEPAAHH